MVYGGVVVKRYGNFRLFEVLQMLPILFVLPIILLPLIWQLGRVGVVLSILKSSVFQFLIYVSIFIVVIDILWELVLIIMQQCPMREIVPMFVLHLLLGLFLLFAFTGGYAEFLDKLDVIVERLLL